MKNEDVQLIEQFLAGDEDAFVSLVNKYQKQVHALTWRKIGDFHIAEEITQDTFLKVYQKLETLRNPKQFSGWLYVIANRECLAWLRKKKIPTESLEDSETEPIDETAYSRYVAEEHAKATTETQREVVNKLLAKLKESERTVMTLHYFGEMTIEEISRFLGVSASAIKLRLHRARQRLQKEEPMIREALSNFQLSPYLTDNIMQKIKNIKPTMPSGSKPFIPWIVGASTAILIVLMLGVGSQNLERLQQPFSLDAQSEIMVELIDTPIAQNLEEKLDNRNLFGQNTDDTGKGDGDGQESNQVLSDEGDYTQWNLPENAKARLSKGNINDINFSPDGTRIAVASATGVWIYDIQTGDELALLSNDISLMGKVTFSPDGKTVATGWGDKISLWDIDKGKLLKSFKRERSVIDKIKITDDGKTLLCEGHDGAVRLWDISTGEKKDFLSKSTQGFNAKVRNVLGRNVYVVDLHLSKNKEESILAVGSKNGEIWFEDAYTGKRLKTIQGHKGRKKYVYQLAFSPDGTLLVSNTDDSPLHLWDVTSGKLLNTLTKSPRVWGILTFSQDGKTLACQSYSRKAVVVELWDVDTQTLRATLTDTDIDTLAFSPDSKTVAGSNRKGEIKVWDANNGDEMSSLTTGSINSLESLVFSPSRNILVSGHAKSVRLWDTFNFTQLSDRIDIDTHLDALVFSPKDMTVTSAVGFTHFKMTKGPKTVVENFSSKLSVWKTHTGEKLSELPVESRSGDGPEPGQIYNTHRSSRPDNVAFSKNGFVLAAVLNEDEATKDYRFTTHLWAIPFEKSHAILKGHTAKINTIVLTPDGKTLASGSDDGTIRLWDTSTGHQLLSLTADKIRTLAISVDGKILASSNANNIKLWDIPTGRRLKTLKTKNDSVTALAISLDTKILTSGNHDGTIRLWDIATGKQLTTFNGHFDMVNALSFSSDEKTLASGSDDGAIFLWNLPDF